MCGIDPQQQQLQAELLSMGIGFVKDAIEILKSEGLPNAQTSDVLAAATAAYQQGKITKSQYIEVINALDESDWVKNGTKPPTHPMVARLIEDARFVGLTRFN